MLTTYLQRLEAAVAAMGQPRLELTIENKAPPGVEELLAQQIAIIERTLVRTTNQQIANRGVVAGAAETNHRGLLRQRCRSLRLRALQRRSKVS